MSHEHDGTTDVGGHNIVQCLKQRGIEQPHDEALTFLLDGELEQRLLTYGELHLWATQIAVEIQSLNRPGEPALVLCPPGPDFVAAFYGALYGGAIPVLFAPPRQSDEPAVFRRIVDMVDPAVVIAPGATRHELESLELVSEALAQVPWVATDEPQSGTEVFWREPEFAETDAAYIMLTSGTTSIPKGTVWSHATLAHGLRRSEKLLRLAPSANRRSVSWAPPYHIAALLPGIAIPIYIGYPATHLTPTAFTERPMRWLEAISRSRATSTSAPTFAYDLCARLATEGEIEQLDLSCLQSAVIGAEMIRPDVMERFVQRFSPCGFRPEAFTSMYGMTEGGVSAGSTGIRAYSFSRQGIQQSDVIPVPDDDDDAVRLIGHGPVLPDMNVAFVDPVTLRQRAAGEVGELLISGGPMAQGYWRYEGDPDVNFNTYLPETGEGPFFRTGDLAFLHDDNLFIAGRAKEVIIIRGRNISPHDVEMTAERSHPALSQCRSSAFSVDVGNDEGLVIVQEVPEGQLDLDEILRAVRASVAATYQVQPHAVALVPTHSLPTTAVGKIQRRASKRRWLEGALPVLAQRIGAESGGAEYMAPRTAREEMLAHVLAQVLKLDRIGIDDNFFELGGDSLLSMQFIARLREEGIRLTVQQLVEHPTVRQLSALESEQGDTQAEQGPVVGEVPLTPTQHHYFEEVTGDHEFYGGPYYAEVPNTLDPSLLRQAICHLLEHHDALRMRFAPTETGWSQTNAPFEEHETFSWVDLPGVPDDDADARMREAVWRARTGINVTEGPLLYVVYVTRDAGQPSLLIVRLHHLVMDAYSMQVWFEDLQTAYEQLSRHEGVRLPAKTTSFKAWAERLQEYAASPEIQAELPYWLDDARRAVSPLPRDGDPESDGWSRQVRVHLSVEETAALLREVPSVYGSEINDVLLAAVVEGVGSLTGEPFLQVEMFSHGRDPLFGDTDIDLTRTMGWLTTMFPMLIDLRSAGSPGEALRTAKAQLRALPNRGLGYGILRYLSSDTRIRRELTQLPWPQVNLNYTGQIDPFTTTSNTAFSGATRMRRRPDRMGGQAARPLTIWSQVQDQQLQLAFQYRENFNCEATIEHAANQTIVWLRALLAESRSSVLVR